MVSIVNGTFTPIPFDAVVDPLTQRTTVRMVDVTAEHYRIARRYMTRLEKEDFDHRDRLARCASIVGLPPDTFRQRFSAVI
jgi:6-phosphofructokinase 1